MREGTEHWFFRLHDPDIEIAARRWDAGAVIRRESGGALVLVSLDVLLGGGELDALKRQLEFRPSVPGLARQMIEKLDCRINGRKASSRPIWVKSTEEFEALHALLIAPDRRVPAIIFSEGGRVTQNPARDASAVAGRFAGLAECFVLSEECAWLLTEALGRQWSVYNGAVRVYRTAERADFTDSPYDHPIFLPNRTEQFHDYLDHLLRETTTRRYELPLPRLLFSERSATSRVPSSDCDSGELREQISVFERRIADLVTDAEGYEGLLMDAGKFEAEATTKITQLSDRQDELARRVEHLQDELSFAEKQLREAGILSYRYLTRYELDKTVNFAKWAEAVLQPWVVFTDRSLDGVDNFDRITLDDGYLPRLSQAFFAIRDVVRGQNPTALGDHYRAWQIEVTRCFSNRNDIKSYPGYDLLIEGNLHKMEWHAKWGRGTDLRSSFRVYFYWDEPAKRAVVGHFPTHLPNNLTSNR